VKTRASLDQPDDAVRDVDHLLEVVEEQQQALPLKRTPELVDCRLGRARLADDQDHRLERGVRLPHQRQVDEEDAVLEAPRELGGRLQS
jgi:hypothetical protein